MIGNLFVGHAAFYQWKQLLLAPSQPDPRPYVTIRRTSLKILEQQFDISGRADTLALSHGANGTHNLQRRSILKDIAYGTQPYRGQEASPVVFHRN